MGSCEQVEVNPNSSALGWDSSSTGNSYGGPSPCPDIANMMFFSLADTIADKGSWAETDLFEYLDPAG